MRLRCITFAIVLNVYIFIYISHLLVAVSSFIKAKLGRAFEGKYKLVVETDYRL